MNYKNLNVVVCGMAISGAAAARLLKNLGSHVTIFDIKEAEKFKSDAALLEQLEQIGVKLCFGKNPDNKVLSETNLIVISPGIPLDLPFLEKASSLNIPIWSEIELAYSVCPSNSKIVAITGTNGKTTTTALTGQIFKNYNNNTEIVGNIGIPFSKKVVSLKEKSIVVAEISSFQLETSHKFNPAACAVLNITPDHLNRHKTLESYIDIKKKIFKNQTKDNYTVLNYDDETTKSMAHDTNGSVVFFSTKTKLEKGVFVDNDDENNIKVCFKNINETIIKANMLQILGKHNLENALAAIALSVCLEVPIEIIRKTLLEFKGVYHRLEFVAEKNGIVFYNDSKATNPDSAIKALEAIDKPIILIGGGYDKGSDFGEWVKLFEGKVKHIVVLGEVSDKIIETLKAYNYFNFDKVNSLKDAVLLAYKKAQSGDCVLLSPACASWGMFDNFEQRGNMFKEFVLEICNGEESSLW